jgi:hypothetical protein
MLQEFDCVMIYDKFSVSKSSQNQKVFKNHVYDAAKCELKGDYVFM